ncbi:hypothetical protein DV735_g320, partial [Chaetothyriales sp. CBS 134920]
MSPAGPQEDQPSEARNAQVPRRVVVAMLHRRNTYDLEETTLLDALTEAQQACMFTKAKRDAARRGQEAADSPGWRVDPKGLLRKDNQIYVPVGSALRGEILARCHDDPLGGHFGVRKTTELVGHLFFWLGMTAEIASYVRSCDVCQRSKAKRHRPYGELTLLPVLSKPWEEVTMDFITDLPPCRLAEQVFNTILVIGSLFTSAFWSALCYSLKMQRKLSTAFHPQTDGQTERQNQVLEHYLWCYTNHRQDDWAGLLAQAEFAYNSAKHASTGMSPF